jgi:hypothetical protein
VAYAFYGPIEASAERQTDVAKLLGCLMAHELGHLLLVRGSHSPAGLMKNRWSQSEMDLVTASLLMFTKEQAKSIRLAVRKMNADHSRRS